MCSSNDCHHCGAFISHALWGMNLRLRILSLKSHHIFGPARTCFWSIGVIRTWNQGEHSSRKYPISFVVYREPPDSFSDIDTLEVGRQLLMAPRRWVMWRATCIEMDITHSRTIDFPCLIPCSIGQVCEELCRRHALIILYRIQNAREYSQ
jgi:hypothetical protein